MIHYRSLAATLILLPLLSVREEAQTLWKEPQPASTFDWTWGSGGQEMAPRPPFQFVKEELAGTNPKVEIKDGAGKHWTVKFGSEVEADTFAPRLLSAIGYAAEPTYFVRSGSITDAQGLKRARHYISKTGSFQNARFKLKQHHSADASVEKGAWSWVDNPFLGTRELGGLKILIMLMSNWDTKDARDGEGTNNKIIEPPASSSAWYAVTDWGASLGKSGGFFQRDRWDWNGYAAQSAKFARAVSGGGVDWEYRGKRGKDITTDVGVEDVRWLLPYLSPITDEDLKTGLMASGASAPVASDFARSMRTRILQLQRIAQSDGVQQASK